MELQTIPFRLPAERLALQVEAFNRRAEIGWFGFRAQLEAPADAAVVRFERLDAGALGGGGTAAVNGGVIAAGFDAACVLAALCQYDTGTVVTLTLQVQYLRLARAGAGLEFRAAVTRSARSLCFVQGVLRDASEPGSPALATASATLAPAGPA
jgi:acyl-coenzyme A thioesterase PaaI-like protein